MSDATYTLVLFGVSVATVVAGLWVVWIEWKWGKPPKEEQ